MWGNWPEWMERHHRLVTGDKVAGSPYCCPGSWWSCCPECPCSWGSLNVQNLWWGLWWPFEKCMQVWLGEEKWQRGEIYVDIVSAAPPKLKKEKLTGDNFCQYVVWILFHHQMEEPSRRNIKAQGETQIGNRNVVNVWVVWTQCMWQSLKSFWKSHGPMCGCTLKQPAAGHKPQVWGWATVTNNILTSWFLEDQKPLLEPPRYYH